MQFKPIIFRTLSLTICFAVANLAVPQSLVLAVGQPIQRAVEKKMATAEAERKALAKRRAASRTQPLTEKQMNLLQGSSAQCPYIAGASKWDPQYEGVDMVTGNYSMSATDLSFDGGYGIPVNITRSYSANDANEGPFGYGWSLSADVRTTAGGILKSKGAPVRSVPVTLKDRSAIETDPNLTVQPVDAVTADDSSGKAETIQKDADGVLSPAAWDQNTTNTTYQNVIVGTSIYQVISSETMTTPDGTVYVYQAKGSYQNGGTYPYGQPTAAKTPANVLKCVSATDRNGNTTTYNYSGATVSFQKIDGTTLENELGSIAMPNGHTIYLNWGTINNNTATRVLQVFDTAYGSMTPVRTVNYTYDSFGCLWKVTSPANLTTVYTNNTVTAGSLLNNDTSKAVVTAITSPQGLTTNISYFVGLASVAPYNATVEGVQVCQILEPSGVINSFYWNADETYGLNPNGGSGYEDAYTGGYIRTAGGSTLSSIWDTAFANGPSFVVWQFMDEPNSLAEPLFQNDTYDIFSQNNTSSTSLSVPDANLWYQDADALSKSRQLGSSPYQSTSTTTTTTYNFQGKPLDSTLTEVETLNNRTSTTTRTATTSYAYWGADKYYQQMAVVDPGGRVSVTDYYSNLSQFNNPVGTWGQKYRVWDPKYGGITVGTGIAPDGWRGAITEVANQYSGQFSYDSKGRVTSVQKLQAATPGNPSTYRYVTTAMTYGTDSDCSWGQAIKTVEDSGGINRATSVNQAANGSYSAGGPAMLVTAGFTPWGKPADSVDAAGHEFLTYYDKDDKVWSVQQTGAGSIATYAYGAANVENGQPTAVTDNLTNVSQAISYNETGTGIGQVLKVIESRGGNSDNTCTYAYYQSGDRQTATYTDGSGNLLAKWGYYDYIGVGAPSKNARAFRTLCKLDSGGNRTSEEFQYAYDTQGRVIECAFAQSPSQTNSDSGGWYDTKLAATRCRAHYEYDAGGRLYWLGHYWDTLSNNAYTSQAILGQACDYEVTGLNRGLKLDAKYETPSAPGSSTFQISQTDTYGTNGYDSKLDYLVAANYGDGLANASPTWSYDAAGNRSDAITDNLNRATSIGGVTCTNDLLGNRLTMGSNSYGWDQLNRLKSYNSTTYVYRADGMRTYKTNSTGSTSYRYDGQMGMEDIDYAANGSVSKVTDYGIGARGIDGIYVTQSGSTTASYPIYDAHGSMISTLSRQGSGYATSALRTFDAWGLIRIGGQNGDPKGRYCATLGHKQDDESGLVYMRARYYEPGSGRFLSEDMSGNGCNWFSYCSNNPINYVDPTGKTKVDDDPEHAALFDLWLKSMKITCGLAVIYAMGRNLKAVMVCIAVAAAFGNMALGETNFSHSLLAIMNLSNIGAILVAASFDAELLGLNAETAILTGVILFNIAADIAGLAGIDG